MTTHLDQQSIVEEAVPGVIRIILQVSIEAKGPLVSSDMQLSAAKLHLSSRAGNVKLGKVLDEEHLLRNCPIEASRTQ